MNDSPGSGAQQTLRAIAYRVMRERGLEPDFPPAALEELRRISGAAAAPTDTRDLRDLLWCSIDNDDSRDLDQLSVAQPGKDGGCRLLVAIADVASLVAAGSALDAHAQRNTTSVYTPAQIFPMLPERLSTDLTSLNADVDRLAWIVDLSVDREGRVGSSEVYPGLVRNRAKLAYRSVGAWLSGVAAEPSGIARVPGLAENVRRQYDAAAALRRQRHQHGALTLASTKLETAFIDGKLRVLSEQQAEPAKALIEDLMIAANGVTARWLAARGVPSVRRVVRTPKQWDRIVEVARERGTTLPDVPDAPALDAFLRRAKADRPADFPDLSLAVIKLLGPGEYVVEVPGQTSEGHFGLAVRDYAHTTAPNRRYPDLITQRLLRSAVGKDRSVYSVDELRALALRCTAQEDAAKKVERQLLKSAAAMLLSSVIGREFDAFVTGASTKGTWVRLADPAVEGRLIGDAGGRRVGDRLRVRLVHTDVERGFIDLQAVN